MINIVDTHIHFWDPSQLRYDWLQSVPAINKPFLPQDLSAQSGRYSLEKLVFVQAGAHRDDALAEVDWVAQLSQTAPMIGAIVADAPLEEGPEKAKTYLNKLSRFPLVTGVRRLIQSEGPGFATQADFVAAVNLLPQFNLSFDICIHHHQMGEIVELVQKAPDVNFVLDHFGKPDIKGGQLDPWRREIEQLAAHPNVSCKLSGLITEADHATWTTETLQPYIDHVITVFGVDRLMYGGDWPVSLLASSSWDDWVTVAQQSLDHLSQAEQQKVFNTNARRFYRLSAPT